MVVEILLWRKAFLAPLILKEICPHPDGLHKEDPILVAELRYEGITSYVDCQDLGPLGANSNMFASCELLIFFMLNFVNIAEQWESTIRCGPNTFQQEAKLLQR